MKLQTVLLSKGVEKMSAMELFSESKWVQQGPGWGNTDIRARREGIRKGKGINIHPIYLCPPPTFHACMRPWPYDTKVEALSEAGVRPPLSLLVRLSIP